MYLNICCFSHDTIQEGTYGTARVAVKYIRMQSLHLHNDNLNDADSMNHVQEFNILCRLHHPRCVAFYGISHDAENILLVQVCACVPLFFLFFLFFLQLACPSMLLSNIDAMQPPHHPASSSLSLSATHTHPLPVPSARNSAQGGTCVLPWPTTRRR
jgi:hypothetical protein